MARKRFPPPDLPLKISRLERTARNIPIVGNKDAGSVVEARCSILSGFTFVHSLLFDGAEVVGAEVLLDDGKRGVDLVYFLIEQWCAASARNCATRSLTAAKVAGKLRRSNRPLHDRFLDEEHTMRFRSNMKKVSSSITNFCQRQKKRRKQSRNGTVRMAVGLTIMTKKKVY